MLFTEGVQDATTAFSQLVYVADKCRLSRGGRRHCDAGQWHRHCCGCQVCGRSHSTQKTMRHLCADTTQHQISRRQSKPFVACQTKDTCQWQKDGVADSWCVAKHMTTPLACDRRGHCRADAACQGRALACGRRAEWQTSPPALAWSPQHKRTTCTGPGWYSLTPRLPAPALQTMATLHDRHWCRQLSTKDDTVFCAHKM